MNVDAGAARLHPPGECEGHNWQLTMDNGVRVSSYVQGEPPARIVAMGSTMTRHSAPAAAQKSDEGDLALALALTLALVTAAHKSGDRSHSRVGVGASVLWC